MDQSLHAQISRDRLCVSQRRGKNPEDSGPDAFCSTRPHSSVTLKRVDTQWIDNQRLNAQRALRRGDHVGTVLKPNFSRQTAPRRPRHPKRSIETVGHVEAAVLVQAAIEGSRKLFHHTRLRTAAAAPTRDKEASCSSNSSTQGIETTRTSCPPGARCWARLDDAEIQFGVPERIRISFWSCAIAVLRGRKAPLAKKPPPLGR